jgi:hypothetical protein
MEEMWYGRTEEWRLRLAELCRQVVIVADTADPRAEVRSDGLTGERTEPSCRPAEIRAPISSQEELKRTGR